MPRPGGPPAHQLADHPMESIHQFLKHAFMFPLAEVVEDGIVGRKILGQHTPLAACLQYIHDGIHDVSERVLSFLRCGSRIFSVTCHCLSVRLVGYWLVALID